MRIRQAVFAVSATALLLGSSGCTSNFWTGHSNDDTKQMVLKEIERRGFEAPQLAPDRNQHRTVYVYAGYEGCRLLFAVDEGKINYTNDIEMIIIEDASPTKLDQSSKFDPCRQAESGAEPTA